MANRIVIHKANNTITFERGGDQHTVARGGAEIDPEMRAHIEALFAMAEKYEAEADAQIEKMSAPISRIGNKVA